jgi:type 1 fimbriae regulatory protein FimE
MPQPLPDEQKPKVSTKRLHLRPDEAQRLIEAAGKRGRYPFRDKVLVRLTYRHGLRAAEAVGMCWDQIDLDNGILHVRRSKGGNPSTHTMERDELRDLRRLRKEAGNSLHLFETERGGPMSVDALQYIVRAAGRLAGLDVEAHPHMLRHAAGYCLINEGVDVRLVQDFLGHKNIATTAHYTALSPKRLANVRVR